MLWKEIYNARPDKPDYQSITLEKMLEDRILNYTNSIYRISNVFVFTILNNLFFIFLILFF